MMRHSFYIEALLITGIALGTAPHAPLAGGEAFSNASLKSESETKVIVTQEDAGELSNEDVNFELAKTVGAHFLERTRIRVSQASTKAGTPFDISRISVNTAIAKQNGKNFIINRLLYDNINYSTAFVLIEGGLVTRVVCMSMRKGEEVHIPGACSAKLEEEIGFRVF